MLLPCELWAQELIEQWNDIARLNPPGRETTGGISSRQYEDLGGVIGRTGAAVSTDDPGPFGRPNPPGAAAAQTIQRTVQQSMQGGKAYDPYVDSYTDPYTAAPQAAPQAPTQPAYPAPQAPYTAPSYATPQQPYAAQQPAYASQQAAYGAPQPAYAAPQPAAAPVPQPAARPAADRSAAFAQNPLRLTQAAAAGLRLMQRQQNLNGVKVRVAVGRTGYEVDFTEDAPKPGVDFMYVCDGITLLVDRDSAALLTGVQMDLVHSPQGMGFVFRSAA
jgi:Fe-S cluster assembly iron-binding protein IscA